MKENAATRYLRGENVQACLILAACRRFAVVILGPTKAKRVAYSVRSRERVAARANAA